MNAMHTLLIDVGNGRTKLALASRDDLHERRETSTGKLSAESLAAVLEGWRFDRIVACSVVPRATEVLREVFGARLLELRHDGPLGIGIRYPRPQSIGPDRLANAVALASMHTRSGQPGIVIDFGTAVTFDVLSADHHYIGGVIAPGLNLMTDYLHQRTALLPQVVLREPETAIGQSTEGAILAGAAIGYRGMVKGILEALRKELALAHSRIADSQALTRIADSQLPIADNEEANAIADSQLPIADDEDVPDPNRLSTIGYRQCAPALAPVIVATGGDAGWIVAGMDEGIVADPDLTLHGLRLVANLAAR